MLTLGQLLQCVEKTAPFSLAEDWDHVGLMVGSASWPVHKVWTALDITEELLLAAKSAGVDGVCVHHPLLFSPLNALTDATVPGKLALLAANLKIGIIAAHTNLDMAEGGVNDALAGKLCLNELERLKAFPMARIGRLSAPIPTAQWIAMVEEKLQTPWIRCIGNAPDRIQRVAILGGAGGDLIELIEKTDADVYLTGEIKYHQAMAAKEKGLFCVECGHDATEKVVLEPWSRDLQKCGNELQCSIEIMAAPVNTSPYVTVRREG